MIKFFFSQVQSVVLAHPMGVNRLVELLTEHEIIRNETLLLLEALTQDNENIKKIVAFEGFARLFYVLSKITLFETKYLY
jgi:precorrin-6B methylase 1